MSRHIVSAGGFYAYVVKGLGRPMGLAAGFIAMLGYNGFVAGAIGTSGFFTGIIIAQLTGLDLPWIVWSLISVVLVFLLTRAGIAFSAKVLGVCLIAEITILLVLDVAILLQTGYSFQAFAPSSVFTPTIGLGLLFAGTCFLGFEATGLFSEEAKDPRRTIPRAIYIAILFIGAFATITSCAIVSALGVAAAQDAAVEHLSTGDLVFTLSQRYLGTALTDVMMVLLLVSLFAALLALHNAAARYIYAYGRVGILPGWLGRTHGRTGAPHTASFAQLVFGTAVALVFFALGLDPILLLVPAMTGFGTLAIIMLQLLAAIAVVAYFRRLRTDICYHLRGTGARRARVGADRDARVHQLPDDGRLGQPGDRGAALADPGRARRRTRLCRLAAPPPACALRRPRGRHRALRRGRFGP